MALRLTFNPIHGILQFINTLRTSNEGVDLGETDVIDFVGAGVNTTYASGVATVTIPGAGSPTIPQLNADPALPSPESAWVRKSGVGGGELKFLFGGGTPITSVGTPFYEFSYRTLENTTVRVALT